MREVSVRIAASKGKGKDTGTAGGLHALLAVSLQHLDPDTEMRKFFGAKVVAAAKSGAGSGSGAGAGSRRTAERAGLTKPKRSWWPANMREGLSLRPLSAEEMEADEVGAVAGERWWTVEYSKRYKGVTRAFMQIVQAGGACSQHFPWTVFSSAGHRSRGPVRHSPAHPLARRHPPPALRSVLASRRSVSHPGRQVAADIRANAAATDHSTAVDFIERAVFTYERAFVGGFNFAGANRLDFLHVENRPFFLALHRQTACVAWLCAFAPLLTWHVCQLRPQQTHLCYP
jgi:hypothetical protein